jgi:hypothetical protein
MKTSCSSVIYFSIFMILFSSLLIADTDIPGGQVHGTWTLDGSPYFIQGNIEIPADSTLTIEPGVVVEFQGHYSLQVQGRLLAVGTETDTILFTINDTTGFSNPDTSFGGWYGIRFSDTPQHNDSSKIVYCKLEYGKALGSVWYLNAGGAICIIQFDKVLIAHCLITNNCAISSTDHTPIGGGIYLFNSDVIIRDNIFSNNFTKLGGAVFFDNSNPEFRNNTFINNSSVEGGGVGVGGTSYPTFTSDIFINNTASFLGGGLSFYNPSRIICNALQFRGNFAESGGGICASGGDLKADSCEFIDNKSELWGGGVAGNSATFSFSNCTFIRDTSNWGSGGLHMDHATGAITQCDFIENNAVFGGGFHSVYSQIVFNQTEFLNNHAEAGAGLHLENSDLDMTECVLQGNYATNGSGGAIDYNVDTTIFGRPNNLQITKSTIEGNSASGQTGGLRIEQINSEYSLVDVVVEGCKIINNHADIYASLRIAGNITDFTVSNSLFQSNTSKRYVGGAGFIAQSTGEVFNCIFSCNYSSYSDSSRTAHGVSLGNEAKVDFFNCTFFDSSDADGIGLSARRGSEVTVTNSIFWGCGNTPINITTAADLGCTVTVNHCAIENGIDSVYVSDSLSTLNWGIGNIDVDPLFMDAQNMDFHLQDISPCIGSGIDCIIIDEEWHCCPTSDFEGNPRPNPTGTNPDIGAYENLLDVPVIIENNTENQPQKFTLFQNYPNPFNPKTVIRYALPVTCHSNLTIYNILGQKVATLVNKKQPAGSYKAEWDASAVSSGIYLYKIEAGTWQDVKKMVLLR